MCWIRLASYQDHTLPMVADEAYGAEIQKQTIKPDKKHAVVKMIKPEKQYISYMASTALLCPNILHRPLIMNAGMPSSCA